MPMSEQIGNSGSAEAPASAVILLQATPAIK
jgi:hypothetical protein